MSTKKYNILYVDDERSNLVTFKATFKWDYNVYTASTGDDGIKVLNSESIHLIIADQRMPGMSGYEFFKKVVPQFPEIILVILTGYADLGILIKSINEFGIYQYLTKPWNEEEMKHCLQKGLEIYQLRQDNRKLIEKLEEVNEKLEAENHYLKQEIKLEYNFNNIITSSPRFRKELEKVEQVAPTKTNVLIRGESGTGKELIARAIHNVSNRNKEPLLKVNCAALPEDIIESELFGHEKGAFTGAIGLRKGRFELAHNGTIFLDEIGEMPLKLQAKILRVLQEGEFERLGGEKTLKVDVRVIAATNKDLEVAIRDGSFREDLYYRLNVFPITCIPLRERREDVPLLIKYFLNKYESVIGKRISRVPTAVIKKMTEYHWPGNIRELENMIERSMIVTKGNTLELGDWTLSNPESSTSSDMPTLLENEKKYLVEVLTRTSYRVSGRGGAAEILGMNTKTLYSKLEKLGIRRP